MRRVAILLLLLAGMVSTGWADQPPRKYVIFFQEWSADIDGPADEIIGQLAKIAKSESGTMEVIGFADPTGSKKANVLVSELRAQRVVDLLMDAGVAPARLKQLGKGSVKFAISAQEARRVEISFHKR